MRRRAAPRRRNPRRRPRARTPTRPTRWRATAAMVRPPAGSSPAPPPPPRTTRYTIASIGSVPPTVALFFFLVKVETAARFYVIAPRGGAIICAMMVATPPVVRRRSSRRAGAIAAAARDAEAAGAEWLHVDVFDGSAAADNALSSPRPADGGRLRRATRGLPRRPSSARIADPGANRRLAAAGAHRSGGPGTPDAHADGRRCGGHAGCGARPLRADRRGICARSGDPPTWVAEAWSASPTPAPAKRRYPRRSARAATEESVLRHGKCGLTARRELRRAAPGCPRFTAASTPSGFSKTNCEPAKTSRERLSIFGARAWRRLVHRVDDAREQSTAAMFGRPSGCGAHHPTASASRYRYCVHAAPVAARRAPVSTGRRGERDARLAVLPWPPGTTTRGVRSASRRDDGHREAGRRGAARRRRPRGTARETARRSDVEARARTRSR